MTATYELRVHKRDVNIELFGQTYIGPHTGYDLITTYEDNTQTIQYMDLYCDELLQQMNFYVSPP